MARPRDEADVVTIARACARHRVPLTERGGGTGNYGQAMPLERGLVLDMTGLDRVRWIKPGLVRVEAGKMMLKLERETRPEGWELQNLLTAARLLIASALAREETRGVHSRRDFPETDDDHWRRHVTVRHE